MKYFLFILISLYSYHAFSQGYIEVKENEPFRKANMILIEFDDTTNPNAFTAIAKTLVKYNFTIKEAYKEFGTITTNYNNNRGILDWRCFVVISNNEIRIYGKYKSGILLGTEATKSVFIGNDNSKKEDVMLDYRNDLEEYYNEMTEIANTIKEQINGKKLFHVQTGATFKYQY